IKSDQPGGNEGMQARRQAMQCANARMEDIRHFDVSVGSSRVKSPDAQAPKPNVFFFFTFASEEEVTLAAPNTDTASSSAARHLISEDEGIANFATKDEEEVLNREQGALIKNCVEGRGSSIEYRACSPTETSDDVDCIASGEEGAERETGTMLPCHLAIVRVSGRNGGKNEKPESQDGGENNFNDDDSFTFAMSKLMDKVSQGVKEGTNNLIDSSAQSLDHFRETFADFEHFWS
ncbi:hypothetical protein THAOC_15276, partial [Thalassiosira oceanica]